MFWAARYTERASASDFVNRNPGLSDAEEIASQNQLVCAMSVPPAGRLTAWASAWAVASDSAWPGPLFRYLPRPGVDKIVAAGSAYRSAHADGAPV
jgi:hypothetical protein